MSSSSSTASSCFPAPTLASRKPAQTMALHWPRASHHTLNKMQGPSVTSLPFVIWPLPSWGSPLLPPLRVVYVLILSLRWPHARLPFWGKVLASLPPAPGSLPWPLLKRAPCSHPSPFSLRLIFLRFSSCSLPYVFAYCLSDPWDRMLLCLLANALAHRNIPCSRGVKAKWLTGLWEE